MTVSIKFVETDQCGNQTKWKNKICDTTCRVMCVDMIDGYQSMILNFTRLGCQRYFVTTLF